MVGVVIAQSPVPFYHWPALFDVTQNLVAKQGFDRDGTLNDKIYFRIGWGGCLAVYTNEWQGLIDATTNDRYINVSEYAVAQLDQTGWDADDWHNCPGAPLEVKPYYWGSRPVYSMAYDEEAQQWRRGGKSGYRIRAGNPSTSTCLRANARKSSGATSNYWMLALDAEMYIDEQTYRIGDIDGQYATICREEDVSVEDYRFY